jgi:hypothetical protein
VSSEGKPEDVAILLRPLSELLLGVDFELETVSNDRPSTGPGEDAKSFWSLRTFGFESDEEEGEKSDTNCEERETGGCHLGFEGIE